MKAKRTKMALVVGIIIGVIIGIILPIMISNAQKALTEFKKLGEYTEYEMVGVESYQVKGGDSLWAIAMAHNCPEEGWAVFCSEVHRRNQIDGNVIHDGDELLVPIIKEVTKNKW